MQERGCAGEGANSCALERAGREACRAHGSLDTPRARKPLQGACSSQISCALLFPSSVPACVGGKGRRATAGWLTGLQSQTEPKGRAGGAVLLAPALGSPAGEATYCGSQRSRTLGSWSRW